MIIYSKRAIAMSFNWIFAIIAGVFILFFAIYFASQFINTGEQKINTETAAKLISYLSPLESGFASGLKPEEINFKKETRTFYTCSEDKNIFGEQTLAFSEKFGNDFGKKGLEIPIKNKYVFAEDVVEGKKISIFSKPFSMGFLVGDIIAISSKDYCFFKAPNDFKESLQGMGNIRFEENNLNNCTGTKVCFSNDLKCDIIVNGDCNSDCKSNFDYGTIVNKEKGFSVGYMDNLVYGGIFSSSQIYECNVKRLMKRFNQLGLVYLDKNKILKEKVCDSDVENVLTTMMDSAKELKSSKEITSFYSEIKSMDLINKVSAIGCGIY